MLSTKEEVLKHKIKNLPVIRGIYFLINDTDNIVYIGMSLDLYKRISVHKTCNQKHFRYYSLLHLEEYSKNEILKLESEYIKKFTPYYNKKGNPFYENFRMPSNTSIRKHSKGGRPKGISKRLKCLAPKALEMFKDDNIRMNEIVNTLGICQNSVYKCLEYMNFDKSVAKK